MELNTNEITYILVRDYLIQKKLQTTLNAFEYEINLIKNQNSNFSSNQNLLYLNKIDLVKLLQLDSLILINDALPTACNVLLEIIVNYLNHTGFFKKQQSEKLQKLEEFPGNQTKSLQDDKKQYDEMDASIADENQNNCLKKIKSLDSLIKLKQDYKEENITQIVESQIVSENRPLYLRVMQQQFQNSIKTNSTQQSCKKQACSNIDQPDLSNENNRSRIIYQNKQMDSMIKQKSQKSCKVSRPVEDIPELSKFIKKGQKQKFQQKSIDRQFSLIKIDLQNLPDTPSIRLKKTIGYFDKTIKCSLSGDITLKQEEITQLNKLILKINIQEGWDWGLDFCISKFPPQKGPAIIFSCLQANFVKHFYFNLKILYSPKILNEQDMNQAKKKCLMAAVADILYKVNQQEITLIYLNTSDLKMKTSFTLKECLVKKFQVISYIDAFNLICSYYHVYQQKFGIALLLYSVIMTKGIDNIYNEFDTKGKKYTNREFIDCNLINHHGKISQELINLVLTGKAVSGCFDGKKEWLNMRGIAQRQEIGFLSERDGKNIAIGRNYKEPTYPIWVCLMESECLVLFGWSDKLITKGKQELNEFELICCYGLTYQDYDLLRVSQEGKEQNKYGQIIRQKWGQEFCVEVDRYKNV